MPSRRHGIQILRPDDLPVFTELARRNPATNVFALYRAETTKLEPRWLGGEMWGRFIEGELVAACHVGSNIVPIEASAADARVFAARAASRARTATTIVGPTEPVRAFWSGVAAKWGRPRETRWRQPHMVISQPPKITGDPLVRRTDRIDMRLLYPACVAMYTEEVGVSPEAGGNADLYKARVRQLSSKGWSFARFEKDRIIFKAEVSCVAAGVAQIQGVWVPQDRRGEGLAVDGMAAVVRQVQASIAPTVSLYVNDWNLPARRAYRTVGFRDSGRFATIMY